jgi:hypothetical protein
MGSHRDHALMVFNRNAHKVIKDTIYLCSDLDEQSVLQGSTMTTNEQGVGFFSYLLDWGAIPPGKEA